MYMNVFTTLLHNWMIMWSLFKKKLKQNMYRLDDMNNTLCVTVILLHSWMRCCFLIFIRTKWIMPVCFQIVGSRCIMVYMISHWWTPTSTGSTIVCIKVGFTLAWKWFKMARWIDWFSEIIYCSNMTACNGWI